jgi:hypothetical protein
MAMRSLRLYMDRRDCFLCPIKNSFDDSGQKERPARDGSFPLLLERSVSDAYLPADGRFHVVAVVSIPAEEPVLIAVEGLASTEVAGLVATEVAAQAVPSVLVVEAESGGLAVAAPAGVGRVSTEVVEGEPAVGAVLALAEPDEPEVVQAEAVAVEPAWSQVARDALEAGLVGRRDLRVAFPVDRDESQLAQAEQVVSGDGC